jgi:ubiquitin carboxyl-terminal hydrolase 4/11/15
MRDMPLIEGSTWALVAKSWWRRFEKAATGQVDKEGGLNEDGLGSVDNSSLLDTDGNLNENLVEGVDFDCLPEAAWVCLTALYVPPRHRSLLSYLRPEFRYGTPEQSPIKRKVIVRGIQGEPSVELHPPRFRYFLLTDEPANRMVHGDKELYFTTSYVSTTRALHRDLAAKFHRPDEHRIWQITLDNEPAGTNYPSGALTLSEARVVDPGDKLIGDVISASDAFIVEFKENGRWIADPTDSVDTNDTGMIEDRTPLPLFSQGTDFFSRMGGSSSSTSLGRSTLTVNGLTSPSSISSTSSLNKPTTIATRPRASIKPGTLGLGNLWVH